jgi:serine/threonine-protein kinase
MLARPPHERAEALAAACAGDAKLFAEVQSLLTESGSAAGFLDRPVIDVTPSVISMPVGRRIGNLVIESALGAGGMGEVYRATDTRLKRQVALKVLPRDVAVDPERMARFQREAEMLAALNHPNIAAIYGVEESGGVTALVMELVEGETLAARIARGAMPIPDALRIARQISDALEAAHAHGIIHRDLKPANIKVRSDGAVKLLDFGLAKSGTTSGSDPTQSPNLTSPADMTAMGVVLGTAAYMAPEQAKGLPVDKRADVWAFGTLLYEMLTGRSCFKGDTVTDTLAAILREEPDWSALPAETPAPLRRLLGRSLSKDLDSRLSDMAMVRVELRDAEGETAEPVSSASGSAPWWRPRRIAPYVATLVVVGVATGLGIWIVRRPTDRLPPLVRFSVDLPERAALQASGFNQLAISPDGTHLAYVADTRIYVRSIDQLDAVAITGDLRSNDISPRAPFFSPDGRTIGFWQDRELKRVATAGGTPVTICDLASVPTGASWGPDDQILFGGGAAGVMHVSAAGGKAATLIAVKQGERADNPQQLPGTEWVLFMLHPPGVPADQGQVVVQRPGAPERRVLIDGAKDVRYVSSGHLVFGQSNALMAQPFNPTTLDLHGQTVRVLDDVSSSMTQTPAMYFAVSTTGTLLYLPGEAVAPSAFSRLVQVARDGARSNLIDVSGMAWFPRYSPNGTRLAYAVSASTDTGGAADLWVLDIARVTPTRITFGGNNRFYPIWTRNAARLTFADGSGPTNRLQTTLADGSGGIRALTDVDTRRFPTSWSPDGRALAFYSGGALSLSSRDIWMLNVDGDKTTARPFVQTPFEESGPIFSPNGRWVAYVSDKSGRKNIYATPYPGPGGEVTISAGGGEEPVWSPSGREMFYRHDGKLYAIPVDHNVANLAVGTASPLFEDPYRLDWGGSSGGVADYDISPDGRRFVMVEERWPERETAQSGRLQVILNWSEELKQRVPTR